MVYNEETLNDIYDRTDGRCHICGKKLSFVNYANPGGKGAWEIEHSNPRAKGGSDYLRNLYPACMTCNREKGTASTRTARGWYGRKKAPLSKEEKKKKQTERTIIGGLIGLLGFLANPTVGVIGIITGALIGNSINADSK
jgi:hypothetical protein